MILVRNLLHNVQNKHLITRSLYLFISNLLGTSNLLSQKYLFCCLLSSVLFTLLSLQLCVTCQVNITLIIEENIIHLQTQHFYRNIGLQMKKNVWKDDKTERFPAHLFFSNVVLHFLRSLLNH